MRKILTRLSSKIKGLLCVQQGFMVQEANKRLPQESSNWKLKGNGARCGCGNDG